MHALPEFQTLEDKVTAAANRESDEYFTEISFTFSTKHIAASPDPTDRGSLAVCPLDQHVGLSQEGDRAQQSKIRGRLALAVSAASADPGGMSDNFPRRCDGTGRRSGSNGPGWNPSVLEQAESRRPCRVLQNLTPLSLAEDCQQDDKTVMQLQRLMIIIRCAPKKYLHCSNTKWDKWSTAMFFETLRIGVRYMGTRSCC